MTSLQGSLPRSGSSLWRKDRGRLTTDDDAPGTPVIKHVVIREVWQKKLPSPHALYKIDVMTKSNHWSVLRRYREFRQLHKKLMSQYGIPKDMIPPKKLTANMLLSHLEKRKDALEHYLQRLVNSSTYVSSSPEIMEFLEVRTHDVMSVTTSLSKEFCEIGEEILARNAEFTLTPTQMYCITRQLQLPEPCQTVREASDGDLGNLYGFLYQLKKLCISNLVNKVGPKQELAGHLEFDISLFKALRELRIEGCPVSLIRGLSALHSQFSHLTANYCIKMMKELLVDCVEENRAVPKARVHVEPWRSQTTAKLLRNRTVIQPWLQLTHLTLRHNKLAMFDNSLKLLPVLIHLDMSYNEFVHFDLQQLVCPSLTHLNLSHNEIHFVTGTPRKITNLKSLDLSFNKLEILYALDCFNGLIELDVSCNQVRRIEELGKLSGIPQLKYLSIAGNPFTRARAYRVVAFSYFKGRDVILDKTQMTNSERVKLWSQPSKRRSHSSPGDVCVNDDDEFQSFSPTRSHSFDLFVLPENDNDSGIEGAPSLYDDSVQMNADDSGDSPVLEFTWSYFERQPSPEEPLPATGIISGEAEEVGVECPSQTSAVGTEMAAEAGDGDGEFPEILIHTTGRSVEGLGRSTARLESGAAGVSSPTDEASNVKGQEYWTEESSGHQTTPDSSGVGCADTSELLQALDRFALGGRTVNEVESVSSSNSSFSWTLGKTVLNSKYNL